MLTPPLWGLDPPRGPPRQAAGASSLRSVRRLPWPKRNTDSRSTGPRRPSSKERCRAPAEGAFHAAGLPGRPQALAPGRWASAQPWPRSKGKSGRHRPLQSAHSRTGSLPGTNKHRNGWA
ncbi:hypothetical protein NDU88_001568 [Pleurodeles waltl]|uniref:Uncharacterized protein n=1 Tax=Pleurodeles waltl TaxID=8319 RepID=A0AAV7VZC0_PLEWA|nr:hypothetical protein NDU88_001568 [Pleurodeles waltl]